MPSTERKSAGSAEAPPQQAASVIGNDPSPRAVDLGNARQTVFAMVALLYRIEQQSAGRVRVCRGVADICGSAAAALSSAVGVAVAPPGPPL